MNNKYESDDEILLAKIEDKINQAVTKNKITYSDFLNDKEQAIIKKNIKLNNCFVFGEKENLDRKVFIFYPEKFTEEMINKNLKNIISVIRISLPTEMIGEYEHRNYLSAIIKIGIERSKVGDILVDENGADIFVFDINSQYIIQSLSELTRFRKSKIEKVDLENIREKQEKYEEKEIIVASMRLDNIVSELAKCSRNKATELIENERVLINYETILKNSKTVEFGDIVTIRGKGKFIIDGLVRNTRNDRYIIKTRKYA